MSPPESSPGPLPDQPSPREDLDPALPEEEPEGQEEPEGLVWHDRGWFLKVSVVVEGGVLLAALGLGWFAGIDVRDHCDWSLRALLWGVAATVPLLLVFGGASYVPWEPLQRIRELLTRMLGPSLAACRWYDLLWLGALAGVSEEAMFRGVIQPWMAGIDRANPGSTGFVVALVGSNLLFALLHPVTRTYAVLVGLIGCYLGLVGLLDVLTQAGPGQGQGNLVVPVIAHGLYDFLAFLVIARESRLRLQSPPAGTPRVA